MDADYPIRILTDQYCLLADLFGHYAHAELDMGCGNGSYTQQLAERFPDRLIIGSDVMLGRLRRAEKKKERGQLENMRFLRVESRHLTGYMLPDQALDRVHLLCPDPWPKDKHSAHRLLSSDYCAYLYRVLKRESGIFHFSSDDPNYLRAVCNCVETSGLFVRDDAAIADLNGMASDFERKWLDEGKSVVHMAWRTVKTWPPSCGH